MAIAVSIAVSITCLDQVLFAGFCLSRYVPGLVNADYARLLKKIPEKPAPMLVYAEAIALPGSYITAYSPHIAYEALETMVVPFPDLRENLLKEALAGQHGGVSALGIDYAIVVINAQQPPHALEKQGWRLLAVEGVYGLYVSPQPMAGAEISEDLSAKIEFDKPEI